MTGDSISFERLADVYDATRGGIERGKRFSEDLAPFFADRRGLILDLGVGTGAVAFPLHLQTQRPVFGLDLSPAMLSKADTRLGPGHVVTADACCLPVRDGAAADLVAVWLFQLVGDRAAVLGEAARVLAPGGRFVVVPAAVAERIDSDLEEAMPVWHEHLGRRFTAEEDDALLELAGEAGLRCVERGFTGWQEWDQSPNDEADRIEQRTYSLLLDLDDATWQEKVVPVVDRLRSLPDPDRPRRRGSRHHILVLAHA